jgi:hypothetical protein
MDSGISAFRTTVCAFQTTDTHLCLLGYRTGDPGRIAIEDIDRIQRFPHVREITVGGFTQATFEYFVEKYAAQFEKIALYKCPLIADLSPLETLPDVQYIYLNWVQRARGFWNLTKNPSLKGMAAWLMTHSEELAPLADSTIEELEIQPGFDAKFSINSLAPLADCPSLRRVSFMCRKILDGRIEPLARIPKLERLSMMDNIFPTEHYAWLKAHLPSHVECDDVEPYWEVPIGLWETDDDRRVKIVGKGKPSLHPIKAQARLARYVNDFNAMVAWYRAHPDAPPDAYVA